MSSPPQAHAYPPRTPQGRCLFLSSSLDGVTFISPDPFLRGTPHCSWVRFRWMPGLPTPQESGVQAGPVLQPQHPEVKVRTANGRRSTRGAESFPVDASGYVRFIPISPDRAYASPPRAASHHAPSQQKSGPSLCPCDRSSGHMPPVTLTTPRDRSLLAPCPLKPQHAKECLARNRHLVKTF